MTGQEPGGPIRLRPQAAADAALREFLDAQQELAGLRDLNDRLARERVLERQARAVGRRWPPARPELYCRRSRPPAGAPAGLPSLGL